MSFCWRVSFLVRLALTAPQPWTAILVFCSITAPFWAVILVGIVRLVPQRLNLAFAGTLDVSAECGPAGRVVSKVVNGASGAESNLE